MKNFSFFFLALLPIFSFAQDSDKWSLEIRLSNDHFHIDPDANNHLASTEVTGIALLESRFSYGLGIQATRKLNDKFRLGLGLMYNNRKALASCYCHICDKLAVFDEEHFSFLKIPFFLRYDFFYKEKWNAYTSFGVSPRTLLVKDFGNDLRSIQVEGSFGLGMAYRFNPNYSLSLEAFLVHDLYNINKVEFEEFKYRGLSLQLGMNRYF